MSFSELRDRSNGMVVPIVQKGMEAKREAKVARRVLIHWGAGGKGRVAPDGRQ